MSRSRRRTPIANLASCVSEKSDKRIWHGRMRAHERGALSAGEYDLMPTVNDVSDPWTMGKDWRRYLTADYIARSPHLRHEG